MIQASTGPCSATNPWASVGVWINTALSSQTPAPATSLIVVSPHAMRFHLCGKSQIEFPFSIHFHCPDGIIYKDAPKSDNSDNDEDDDDNEDDENAEEGSAGKLLVF